MQTTEATMVESPVMTRPYRPGIEARRAILRELRRRELAGDTPPSLRDLAESIGLSTGGTHRHIRTMRDAGLLTTRRGNSGYIALTDAGQLAADASL